jgi:biofilm protein TabA
MIVSDITHWDEEKHFYPQAFNHAIDYIKGIDLASISAGKHTIDGELMFALVQEPLTGDTPYLESHETYIDLQYLVAGEEKIGFYRAVKEFEVVDHMPEAKDITFYRHDEIETAIILQPGMFAIFFPNDLHRPCCSATAGMKIKKIVIKIHKQLLEHR